MHACKTLAITALLVLTGSAAFAEGIDCKTIGTAYDNLFVDGTARVDAIVKQFKALPPGANEQQRDAIRKNFCAVGGEIIGLYKFMRALANDCSKRGESMGNVIDVVDKQLALAQDGVKICK
jgi:hypothetical protein